MHSTATPNGESKRGRSIASVLATVRYQGAHLARLRDALAPAEFIHLDAKDGEGIARALKTSDVAILAGDLDQRFLDAPGLRWIHCDHAGLNGSAKPAVFQRDLIVTGSAGRAAPALAQHVLFFALALTYDCPGLAEMKAKHIWRGLPGYGDRRGLWGKTMGIIGYGLTGVETAALAKACGMRVLAHRKRVAERPGNVDRIYAADAGEGIDDILKESDVVVLSMRLNDATHHMVGARELKLMKRSAYLINIARGAVIDQKALIAALHDGTIAGAGLDVFDPEPIPADDPIWDAPNTIITPHVTAEMPDLQGRSLDIIAENIRRYRAGEPMLNRLVPEDVYTKG